MSVTIALIPLAIAAATFIAGGGIVAGSTSKTEDGGAAHLQTTTAAVRTRMKDLGLLEAALGDIHATDLQRDGDALTAAVEGMSLSMARDNEGIWQAHFTGEGISDDELIEAGTAVIARLDTAYAARVQAAVASRIRERADAAGFELTSESVEEDDTVTMVLTVRDGS